MTAPVSELLSNYLGGQWRIGTGKGTALLDPVTGTELVRVDATGLDLAAGFAFAREQGGAALRALSYQQRGALLGAVLKVLQANRDAYSAIAPATRGPVKHDSAVDIDGGLFTLGVYAKMGECLLDGLNKIRAAVCVCYATGSAVATTGITARAGASPENCLQTRQVTGA